MRRHVLAAVAALAVPAAAAAQTAPPPAVAAQARPAPARPADVASAQAIVAALYDVISGPKGAPRDWDRFRSLFFPGARLIPTGRNRATGAPRVRVVSPEEYIAASAPLMAQEGFFETEIANRTERFGGLVQVWSTYASRHDPKDAQPFERGVNSIQLYFDGQRWWVLTVAWAGEQPDQPLPQEYLQR
jgi:hypothetical protein